MTFLTLPARPSKFNPSNYLKTTHRLEVYGETVTIRQNIFHQIFEESVSVKISPHQNFALYGIHITHTDHVTYIHVLFDHYIQLLAKKLKAFH